MHYYRSTVGHLFVFPHVLMRFGGEVTKFTFQHLSLLVHSFDMNYKIYFMSGCIVALVTHMSFSFVGFYVMPQAKLTDNYINYIYFGSS